MDKTQLLAMATSVWGVAMAMSPGMQIKQMLKTGKSEDVSVGYFAVLVVGFVLWSLYGFSIGSMVVAVCNIIATFFGIATIIVARVIARRNLQES